MKNLIIIILLTLTSCAIIENDVTNLSDENRVDRVYNVNYIMNPNDENFSTQNSVSFNHWIDIGNNEFAGENIVDIRFNSFSYYIENLPEDYNELYDILILFEQDTVIFKEDISIFNNLDPTVIFTDSTSNNVNLNIINNLRNTILSKSPFNLKIELLKENIQLERTFFFHINVDMTGIK